MTLRHFLLLFAAMAMAGCGNRAAQNESAVRQGVIDYLSQRSDLNLSTMQVDVTSVSFRQNEADATVSFRPKGGGPGGGMQMRYTLERKGNKWVVKGRGRSGMAGQPPHGAGGAPQQEDSKLPPGHPQIGRPPAGTPAPAPAK